MDQNEKHAGMKKMQSQAVGNGIMNAATSEEIRRKNQKAEAEAKARYDFRVNKKLRADRAKDNLYNPLQVMVIIGLMAAFCAAAVMFIVPISQLRKTMNQVSSNKKVYYSLVVSNDILDSDIQELINVGEIYRIATDELGMAYPQKSQIITYEKSESEHVIQNEDIPKN